MNWFITILLMFVSAIFGLLAAVICFASRTADERIKKIQEISEIRELIIQEAIDNAYVEDSRSEGDYDINISKEGTEEIQKILEGML